MKKIVSLSLVVMIVLASVLAFVMASPDANAVPGYTDITLCKTTYKPLLDGKISAGEYAFSSSASHTSGSNAPDAKYYLSWTDTDLYYSVEMKIDASALTASQKADLLNSIHINTYIYRGDYRTRTADDPAFTEYITENYNGTYQFRYLKKNEKDQWGTHKDGSTRLVCSVAENAEEGYYTVTIEHKFQMDDTVVLPTSTTADGIYTIGSVVSLKNGIITQGKSYFAPGVEDSELYTETTLRKTVYAPAIDGAISAGEYGLSFNAANISGDKAPDAKYYLSWTDTDLYYAVKMRIAASDLTDAQKAELINSISINTNIYRGDYRLRTADDPDYTQYITANQNGTYKFRYLNKNEANNWKAHNAGSARLAYTVSEAEAGYYTVTIEHKFQMDDSVILPTSTTADDVYTISSVVSLKDGTTTVGQSHFAPSAEYSADYTMGYFVATTSDEVLENGGSGSDSDTSYQNAVTTVFDGYTVTLSEPIVVYQGEEGDDDWGHVNFPKVRRTAEGYLRVSWTYGVDQVGAVNTTYVRVSQDEGKTWGDVQLNANVSTAAPSSDMRMPNGKYWVGFAPAGEPTSDELAALIPDSEKVTLNSGHTLILTEDLEKYDLADSLNLIDVSMQEYDPATGTTSTVACTINWPYKAVTMYPGNIFVSPARYFTMASGSVVLASDGALYVGVYAMGFDADAATFADADTAYTMAGKTSVYMFKSTDSGRTWNYLEQFCAPASSTVGFSEPDIIEMPDGSLFTLMRSGHTAPTYFSVSHNDGVTWTTPAQFDTCGVRPQLLGLDCGVTIATYGRPEQFVRTTDDPTGATWDAHIVVPLSNTSVGFMNQSCFNNTLLKIDENSAWLCYTDFQYPNANGVGVKSVILRKITVTMDE